DQTRNERDSSGHTVEPYSNPARNETSRSQPRRQSLAMVRPSHQASRASPLRSLLAAGLRARQADAQERDLAAVVRLVLDDVEPFAIDVRRPQGHVSSTANSQVSSRFFSSARVLSRTSSRVAR